MKLSAAIEKVIRNRKYNKHNEFMCCVLNDVYGPAMAEQLQTHLSQIFLGRPSYPLINRLYDAAFPADGVGQDTMEFWDTSFARTKEWYCWFVYDLKRKGL